MRTSSTLFSWLLLLALVAPVQRASADDPVEPEAEQSLEAPIPAGDAASAPNAGAEEAPAPNVRLPVFVLPNRGTPKNTVSAGTRGVSAPDSLEISALVPKQVGLTIEERPALYWYISRETASGVELRVTRENSSIPVLETSIGGPLMPGVHRIHLANHGLSLKPGITYRWYVTLVPDPKRAWETRVTGGGIERIPPTPALRSELAAADAAEAFFILARAGIWYDALDAISQQIDASPDDETARQQRSALLEQVGLPIVTEADRSPTNRDREEAR